MRTPSITAQQASVTIANQIRNLSEHDAELELMTEIVDRLGTVVAKEVARRNVPKNLETTVEQEFSVTNPELWSPLSPHLYQARCTLRREGAICDQQTSGFGIRTIVFDVDKGLLLNGEHIKMNGVCIHGDGGAVGTAVPERMWERRLELLQRDGLQCDSAKPQSACAGTAGDAGPDGFSGNG